MNTFSKKTVLAITTVASAALVVGFAAPAMASTSHITALADGPAASISTLASTMTQPQLDALQNLAPGLPGKLSSALPVAVSVQVGNVATGNTVSTGDTTATVSGVDGTTVDGTSLTSATSTATNLVATATNQLGAVTGNSTAASATSSAQNLLGTVTGDLGLGSILGGR
jgi:hypothetical protein